MSVFFVHKFLFFFVQENYVTIETRKVMFSGNKLLLGDKSDGTMIIVLMPHNPISCLIFSTHLTRLWKATSDMEVPITWDFIYSS